MKRVSAKLLGFAVLAILFMLMSFTTADPVLGTTTSEETAVRYDIEVEEVVIVRPNIETENKNRKMILQQTDSHVQNKQDDVSVTTMENVLGCAKIWEYCNPIPFIGPSCCSGFSCMIVAGVAGGFCN